MTPKRAALILGAPIGALLFIAFTIYTIRRALLPHAEITGTMVPGGIAPDGSGGVIVGVTYGGSTIETACGPLMGQGLALVHYDSRGHCQSQKSINGAGVIDLERAPDGGFILAADNYANADFGFGQTPSLRSMVITHYDASDKPTWTRSLDAEVAEVSSVRSRQTIAVAPDGKIAVFARLRSDADLGTGKLVTTRKTNDAALALLDATGHTLWARYLGTVPFGGVAIDASGIVLVGTFTGDMNLNSEAWRASTSGRPNAEEGDVFVLKLDMNGKTIFAKHFGQGDATSVVLGESSHILLAGTYFQPSLDLGGGALPTCGEPFCIFFGELDASGAFVFGTGGEHAVVRRIAREDGHAILIAGESTGSTGSTSEAFIQRFSRSGLFGKGRTKIPTEHVDAFTIDSKNRTVILGHSSSDHSRADVCWEYP